MAARKNQPKSETPEKPEPVTAVISSPGEVQPPRPPEEDVNEDFPGDIVVRTYK